MGQTIRPRLCDRCHGTGRIGDNCLACNATGYLEGVVMHERPLADAPWISYRMEGRTAGS